MYPHLNPFGLAAAVAFAAGIPAASSAAVHMPKPSRMERTLAAAGFQAVPANTPQRENELATLPRDRLVAQPRGDGFTYVLADPGGCGCLYMGDAADYQAYQRLAMKHRASQRNADAAERLNALNWDLWGPYDGWGWQGPNFIHSDRGFGGHLGGGRVGRGHR